MQVSTVLPALQEGAVGTLVKPEEPSLNCASVAEVFIAALKVNTTEAEGETPEAPLAGTTETMVG